MVYSNWITQFRNNAAWLVVTILAYVVDRFSKAYIVHNIQEEQLVPVINKVFYITNITNSGAAFGVLQGMRALLIVASFCAGLIILYFLISSNNKLMKLALVTILGGAIGNLHDRILTGRVIDFFDFYFGTYHFPTFNMADVFVVSGSILLMIIMFFEKPKEKAVELSGN